MLPDELAWAAPLLDPERPCARAAGAAQARELLLWHHHLPTWAQVSIACRKLRPATTPGDGRAPAPIPASR
jgi:hypothetical protein